MNPVPPTTATVSPGPPARGLGAGALRACPGVPLDPLGVHLRCTRPQPSLAPHHCAGREPEGRGEEEEEGASVRGRRVSVEGGPAEGCVVNAEGRGQTRGALASSDAGDTRREWGAIRN